MAHRKLDGLPFEIIRFVPPARWHGFARYRVEKVVFEWGADAATPKNFVGIFLEEQGWVWRGFSSRARVRQEELLQSGLMPGAQATPVEISDEERHG